MFQHQHDYGLIEFQGDVQQENREDDDMGGKGEAAPNMLSTLMKTSRIHGSIVGNKKSISPSHVYFLQMPSKC
ncbi:hypothetical protein Tco_1132621 [Tanacetum coccineum]|uniref:Uncharacterized protein n=1 Tax=Tanacetum coccineum TaxID=301880 RepID=A0ABQ5JDU9_9ASTR